MKNMMIALAGFLVIALSGCAAVPMASLDTDAKAKNFKPLPNKAAIFIYRNEVFGAAIPLAVSINGHTLGQTAAKTYFRVDVKPGPYTISSMSENVSQLELNAKTGRSYYVWQEVKMGMWAPGSHLQEVNEAVGQAGVNECKLIASVTSDNSGIKTWR
jgi:hypothetical protein